MSGLRAWVSKALEVGRVDKGIAWVRFFFDGNRWIQLMEQGPRGTLVGTDYNGNRYFENNDSGYTRKRWVIYAETKTNAYNPTTIPPEWHGWINYVNDLPPTTHEFKEPVYAVKATLTATGTDKAYQPKGAWADPDKRNWLKYEAWKPPSSQA
ncbi:NADH dehydrogenase [Monoraphidium neglectum]|uniref:NADH dehydrogenase [ubiquinone] 1 alpha subcomplex subunit 12 n=1 Tax=Monoraphidium neglectum TaxID=145388 RepID=A0A0D2M552_9CHLO|nr:NADH dehydrogenase [Monoraphidium neglectum]KIY96401.1 NADH dehydrogenase [Monoraphidium neglectum]|eukprot:XP_013895421.1 NADH dehydrogenase [Monoraphidium neglectum]